jgi:hypothetical protein
MDRNVGPEDRVVRIVVGLALAALVYLGYLEGTAGIVAGIVAAYLVITGLVVRDPFYRMVGLDTAVQEQPYSSTDDRAGF